MNKNLQPILIILFSCVVATAQQLPSWSSYYESGFVWNPALTGKARATETSITHRQDWMGFEDAPKYTNLSFQFPFTRRYDPTVSSIGAFVERDAVGPFEKINLAFTYSYRFKTQWFNNRNDALAIGILANLGWYQFDLRRATAYDQAALSIDISEVSQRLSPNASLGFYYSSVVDKEVYVKSHYYAGLSVNQLAPTNQIKFSADNNSTNLTRLQAGLHSTFNLGYRYLPRRPDHYVETNLMLIYAFERGIHGLISVRFELLNALWLSGGASSTGEIFAQFGLIVNDNYKFLSSIIQDGVICIGIKSSYQIGSFRRVAGFGMELYGAYIFEWD